MHGGSLVTNTFTVGTQFNLKVYPFYTSFVHCRTQALYLQSEINQAGTIKKIRLQQAAGPAVTLNNTTIYMYETTATTVTSWVGSDNGPGTCVFSGSITTLAAASAAAGAIKALREGRLTVRSLQQVSSARSSGPS